MVMSIFDTFKRGLKKTAVAIGRGIAGIFTSVKKWDDDSFRKLENELLAADFGINAARKITRSLKTRYQQGEFSGERDILEVAREVLCRILKEASRELSRLYYVSTLPEPTPSPSAAPAATPAPSPSPAP